MNFTAVRTRCEECRRVRVEAVCPESDQPDDVALTEAEPGEFVALLCSRCHKVTDHEVLAEAQASA
jgi:hypothetical protein